MTTKNVSLTLNTNELTSPVTSTTWVTGKTVYGHAVTASTEVIQSAGVEYVTLTLSPSTYLDITNNLWCGVDISDVSISIYSTQNVYYGSFTHSSTISVNSEDSMDDQSLTRSASTISVPKGTSLELRVRIKFTKDEPLTRVSSIRFLTPYTFNGTSDSATFTAEGSNYFSCSVSLGTITASSTLNPSQVEPNFHVTINKDTSTIGDIEVLPKGDTIDYQSQTCAFTISWSNIGSDYITISNSGGIDQVKDSNGNVITRTSRTSGSGSITVYADIQFNDGPAGNVYVKASATDANGNHVEDEGWYYQEDVPAGQITWNDKGGEITSKGDFNDVVSIDWSNLNTSYPITFTCTLFDLTYTITSLTISSSTGVESKDWFNSHFRLSENTSTERRSVTITAKGTGLNGEEVTATIASLYQEGSTSPTPTTPKVYVATGTNSVSVTNNYVATSWGEFSVYLSGANSGPVGFRLNSAPSCPTGSTTISGTRYPNTGTTGQYMISYELAATTPTSYPRVTLTWKENSTTKTETVNGRVSSFGPYTVSVDTVLSDFEITINERPRAVVNYYLGPITINNGLSSSVTMASATITINTNKTFTWSTPITAAAHDRISGPCQDYTNTVESGYTTISCNITSFSVTFNENVGSSADKVKLSYRKYGETSNSETSLTGSTYTFTGSDISLGSVPVGSEWNLIGGLNLAVIIEK